MSLELRTALADWLAWVERGAPESEPYMRCLGLCSNMMCTHDKNLYREIIDFFKKTYPFCRQNYWKRGADKTQHKCPARLAWVRKMLADNPADSPAPCDRGGGV